MSDGAAFAEEAALGDLARREAQWRELAARSAEPNPFAESAFLLPALRLDDARRLQILLLWPTPSRTRLIGIAVIRVPLLGQGLARVWRCEQAALAAMLFESERIGEAVGALLAWSRARWGVAGLILPGLEPGGPIASALRARAVRVGSRLERANPRWRAALVVDGAASFEAALEKRRRKEWARQGRRLAERGRLEARLVEGRAGIERFLALESQGWKGARGTALAADPGRLAFARAMLAGFAEGGRLQIHELALDESPIAIGLVLRAGRRAFYWKTAYDEAFAEFSPGVQLTLALSRRLEAEPDLALADSCALQNHPMIDRIWTGRIELVDFAIASEPARAWRLRAWLAAELAVTASRERLKRIANRLLGRKRT